MADKFQDDVCKLIETLDGKHNQRIKITPEQEIKAGYVWAACQPCILCGSENAHAVHKVEVADLSDNYILFALCLTCHSDPSKKYWAKKKVLKQFREQAISH